MKNLLHILFNLAAYYAAGWLLVWVLAIACGAPMNIGEWLDMPRVMVGIFVGVSVGSEVFVGIGNEVAVLVGVDNALVVFWLAQAVKSKLSVISISEMSFVIVFIDIPPSRYLA